MFRIGILIVTHNSGKHIGQCLDAVERLRGSQDVVLVIDNASLADQVRADQVRADQVRADQVMDDQMRSVDLGRTIRVIRNTHNAGFAGAVNQGFHALKGEVDGVLILNPDVVLTTPLDALSEACERAGIAGGCLTDAGGDPQIGFAFRRFPTPLAFLFETFGVNKLWRSNPVNRRYRCLDVDHSVSQMVDQPAGAMLMIRTDVWLRLNGFDERFHPVWFEDVDFCRRAASEGFRAAYVPSVEGVHAGGHSVLQMPNGVRRRHWYASLMRYSRKHFGRAGWGLVAGGVAAAAVARAVGLVLRLHNGSRKAAAMELTIARKALVYLSLMNEKTESAGAADVRSRVSNEGLPSNENTERTLKRLHAR